jgi:hypothetical protein
LSNPHASFLSINLQRIESTLLISMHTWLMASSGDLYFILWKKACFTDFICYCCTGKFFRDWWNPMTTYTCCLWAVRLHRWPLFPNPKFQDDEPSWLITVIRTNIKWQNSSYSYAKSNAPANLHIIPKLRQTANFKQLS